MKPNNIHYSGGLDQTDETFVRSRLRLAFIVFLAIVVFGQSDVFAANEIRNISGDIFKHVRLSLDQVGVQVVTWT